MLNSTKYVAHLIYSPSSCFWTFDLIIAQVLTPIHGRKWGWARVISPPVFPHLTNPHSGNGRGQVWPWWSQFQFHPQHCFKKYFFFVSFIDYYSAWCTYVLSLISIRAFIFRILYKGEETHFTKISKILGWVLKTRSQQSWQGIADWDETLGFWVSYLPHNDNNWFMMASSSDRQRLLGVFLAVMGFWQFTGSFRHGRLWID